MYRTKTKNNEMKKLLSIVCLGCIATLATAQEAKKEIRPASIEQQPISKEQREAMKAKKEADLTEAFKRAEITEEQQKKAREIMADAAAKNKELRNSNVSEEEKMAKKKVNDETKNTQLKELFGEAKYKVFTKTLKELKDANKGIDGGGKE